MSVLLACMYVHCMRAYCLLRSEEGVGCSGTGAQKIVTYCVGAGSPTQVFCKNSIRS